MSRGPDIGTALARAILANAERNGVQIEPTRHDWTRWASATFTGARHELGFTAAASARLDGWLAGLAEAELPIRGHLVADLHVAGATRDAEKVIFDLEALTVEDR